MNRYFVSLSTDTLLVLLLQDYLHNDKNVRNTSNFDKTELVLFHKILIIVIVGGAQEDPLL